jgi:hypothetical protein
VYPWIWRHLPGPFGWRLLQAALLAAAVAGLLLFVVFPWLAPRLPANPLTGPATVGR